VILFPFLNIVSLGIVSLVVGKKDPRVLEKLGLDHDHSGIRCPICGWRPQKHDAWRCDPGCGNVWNTFETRGRCPDCGKQWIETACLHCGEWSLHESWYEEKRS